MSSCSSSSGSFFIFGGIDRECNTTLLQLNSEGLLIKSFIFDNLAKKKILPSGMTLHEIDNQLVIFGGGGNCFSFGTHFNFSPISLVY